MRYKLIIMIVLMTATLLVYWKVGGHDFVILDDQLYVSQNPAIQSGLTLDGILWAFTSTETTGNWHPLTWISHMLDIQLFGVDPGAHHLVNVVFHTMNALLLFLVLNSMTGALWRSATVALLFALHPLHVESVAWIAERKDVLSTFFWMLTLLFYARYVKRSDPLFYLAAMGAMTLGLMAKPMLVTLPFVLLLLDYWPLRRLIAQGGSPEPEGATSSPPEQLHLRRLLLEKVPFLLIAAIFCAIAMYAQRRGGYVPSLTEYPLQLRVSNALLAYKSYLFKSLWPHDLAVFYPFPTIASIWPVVGSGLLLLCISLLATLGYRRHGYLLVGWLWFLGTLVPVIGLVQIGRQSMADRYMYVPLVGLALMTAWGTPELLQGAPRRGLVLATAATAVLLGCAGITRNQLDYWRDSISLLDHTLQVTPASYFPHFIMGNARFQQGKYDEAFAHYQKAVRIYPAYAPAYYKIGIIQLYRGQLDPAIRNFSVALSLDPSSESTRRELTRCLAIQQENRPQVAAQLP